MKEEVKAGITIIASLAILTAFVVLIGGSRLLEKTDVYYVRLMNAAGLETGSLVKLGGVKVGTVVDVKEPDGPGKPVTIELAVRKGLPLYKGTKALVSQTGMVGDIFLLLSVESATNERLKPGGDIPSQESVDLAHVMARMDELLQSVDTVAKNVDALFSPNNADNVQKLVTDTNKAIVTGSASVEKSAAALKGTAEKLNIVLAELDGLVKDNRGEVSLLIKKAKEDLDRAGKMIDGIETTVKTVDNTAGSVDRAVQLQSRNLDELLHTMTRTTEELQDALQEIKRKPWSFIYKEGRGE